MVLVGHEFITLSYEADTASHYTTEPLAVATASPSHLVQSVHSSGLAFNNAGTSNGYSGALVNMGLTGALHKYTVSHVIILVVKCVNGAQTF